MAKKRLAPEATYQDLGQVDRALELIAAVEADAAGLTAERDRRTSEIAADYDPRIESLDATARDARKLVEAFADLHPELFESPRHQDLPHGKIGYRAVASIKLVWTVEHVIAALRAANLTSAINVRESVNKDILSLCNEGTLAEVGAKRVVRDLFYCECAARK